MIFTVLLPGINACHQVHYMMMMRTTTTTIINTSKHGEVISDSNHIFLAVIIITITSITDIHFLGNMGLP
jgi:hypothetical protein